MHIHFNIFTTHCSCKEFLFRNKKNIDFLYEVQETLQTCFDLLFNVIYELKNQDILSDDDFLRTIQRLRWKIIHGYVLAQHLLHKISVCNKCIKEVNDD